MGILLDSYPVLEPEQELRNAEARRLSAPWANRANSYRCQSGPAPGRGWLLMLRRNLDALDKDGLHTLTFDDGVGVGRQAEIQDLVFIRARNVSPGFPADPDAAYLVEVADARYLAQNVFFANPINKQYNVRAPSAGQTYYTDSLNAGVAWTWQTMLDNLWAAVNVPQLGTSPVLPVTPDGAPEGWKFIGTPAWEAYNQVLERIGCVFTLDPTVSQSGAVVQLGAASTALTTAQTAFADRLLLDDEVIESVRGKVPAKVRVFFHRFHTHYGTEQTTIATAAQWSTTPVQVVDVTDPGATVGVQLNSFAALYDDLPAIVDFSGTVTNSAALTTRATERAADYYRQVNTGGDLLHKTYSGIINDDGFLPGPRLAGVAWLLFSDGYKTEVVDAPQMLAVSDTGQWHLSHMPENLLPPDLGRKTYPNYPQTQQLLRVAGTTGTADIYDGFVERFDPSGLTFSDAEAAWLRPVPATPAPSVGAMHLGKLNGTATIAAVTRPLYVFSSVMTGAGGSLTVEEVDGSPSVTSVTTLRFDQVDGFVVSTTGAGVARVDMQAASLTQAGIVSLSAQNMGDGDKTFDDNVSAGKRFIAGGLSLGAPLGIVYFVDSGGQIGIANDVGSDAVFFGTVAGGTFKWRLRGATSPTQALAVFSCESGDTFATPAFGLSTDGGTTVSRGAAGTFTTVDSKTVTVLGGIIISIV